MKKLPRKILWVTWKDSSHPRAGGAELVNEELASRLAEEGSRVIFLTSAFRGGEKRVERRGFEIVRTGNRALLFLTAFIFYLRRLRDWPELVILDLKTAPLFVLFSSSKIFFIHQLCGESWFHLFPPPLSWIGFGAEKVLLRAVSRVPAVTVSSSSKKDLARFGFKKVEVVSEGIGLSPLEKIPSVEEKEPFLLFLGSFKRTKRPHHVVRAFRLLKERLPKVKLFLVGRREDKRYASKIEREAEALEDVFFLGWVEEEEKERLLERSWVLCVPSVKEGWGLVVTEAASRGTPAVVYNTDGLRDSVEDKETGLICERNTPEDMAVKVALLFEDLPFYLEIRRKAWEKSKSLTFERSFQDFKKALKKFQNE